MFLRISIEITSILAHLLSHLIFLELPNVILLRSVHVDFKAFRHIQALLERSTRAHALYLSFVLPGIVDRINFFSFSQEFDELVIPTVGVSLAFPDPDSLFLF